MRKHIFYMFFGLLACFSTGQARIHEIDSIEASKALFTKNKESLILVDLDNCLFEAQQALGHAHWFYALVQERIEKGDSKTQAIAAVYPEWIKTQKMCPVQPLEQAFVGLIKELQASGFKVMGLTHRQPVVKEATLHQVASLGIDFAGSAVWQEAFDIEVSHPATFTGGIIFANDNNSKADVLDAFWKKTKNRPQSVVFIDDKLKNIQDLEDYLTQNSIEHTGIHYRAIDRSRVYCKQWAQVQYPFLDRMMSNDEAQKLIQASIPFFVAYDTLKAKESWQGIWDLGDAALAEDLSPEDRALVCNRLASSVFYLGKHEQALAYAQRGLEAAQKTPNKEAQARSLYLISAAHRALCKNKTQEDTHVLAAQQSIKEALELASQEGVGAFTRAKVFFNAGALAQDVMEDLVQAEAYYQKASALFEPNSDDAQRTHMRLARCLMEQGKLNEAQALTQSLKIEPGSRTGVQLLLLKARIAQANQASKQALAFAQEGLAHAQKKLMQREVSLLEEFINNNSIDASQAPTQKQQR